MEVRRLVVAALLGEEHRDKFDPADAYRRGQFGLAVVQRLGADESSEEIASEVLRQADAEDQQAEEAGGQPIVTNLADVIPRPIRWLWPGFIPILPLILPAQERLQGALRVTGRTPTLWPPGVGSWTKRKTERVVPARFLRRAGERAEKT